MTHQQELPPFSDTARAIVRGWYRHYRGGRYEVLGVARHSETLEELVVYRRDGSDELWVRPVGMWSEVVEYEGRHQERFVREQFV
jgi:hypothetical protein